MSSLLDSRTRTLAWFESGGSRFCSPGWGVPGDAARRQRRLADGVAWWRWGSRPPVRADTSSARTAALGVVVVQCQEGRPA